ncbi:hypothetical protein [Streptomyces sp. NPDC002265]|uniref:TIR domain-containing protein n=1 Tax=Streptomyces sp. NPDC002265 TaxID=3154415 RepID=UPI003326E704
MKVFISWSGPQSQKMAESLKAWLKYVIQSVDPFVSSLDIAKGDRGLRVISGQLEETSFGIVCVTRENSLAPWINFEAGALSKAIGDARVVPCLLDMPVSDLTGPLAQFQVVSSSNREDVFAMVRSLRDYSNLATLDDNHLKTTFDAFWPRLDEELQVARNMQVNAASMTPRRDPGEILEEVLVLTRRQENVLRTIVERVDSSVPMLEIKGSANTVPGKTDARRALVDELIAGLDLPDDSALTFRVITDRVPEEIQVVYNSEAITADNVQRAYAQVGQFANRKHIRATVRSTDGYEIMAVPGKETILLLPAEPAMKTIEDRRNDDNIARADTA